MAEKGFSPIRGLDIIKENKKSIEGLTQLKKTSVSFDESITNLTFKIGDKVIDTITGETGEVIGGTRKVIKY